MLEFQNAKKNRSTMNRELLEKLLDISRKMAENRLLNPLLEYAMAMALDLFNAEYGYLVLLQKDNSLDFRIRQDKYGNELAEPEEQISHTILDDVIKTGKSLVVSNACMDPKFRFSDSVASLHLKSVICVPLIARGKIMGAIYIENRSEENLFTEEDLKPLEYFSSQAAVSIENAMLNDELEVRVMQRTSELAQINERLQKEIEERKRVEKQLHRLATTDPLTGVLNRRHFFSLAKQEFDRSQRYGHQISIILIDVDHFKQVNDTFGHVAGDQLLQSVARRFSKNLRQMDIIGRYGGDEFVILLPETDQEQACQAAQRFHQIVTQKTVDTAKGAIPLKISMGVACRNNSEDIENLLIKTDQALYAAKEAGRNRVSSFDAKSHKLRIIEH
jgi:diguanylate cyclase (GGDEF)-like protein